VVSTDEDMLGEGTGTDSVLLEDDVSDVSLLGP
jgi:hypothetical protein